MLMGAITLFVFSPLNGGAQAAEMESCQARSTTRFDAVVKQDETVQNGSDTSKKDKAKAASAASKPSGS
jgi:hypothetical protein